MENMVTLVRSFNRTWYVLLFFFVFTPYLLLLIFVFFFSVVEHMFEELFM